MDMLVNCIAELVIRYGWVTMGDWLLVIGDRGRFSMQVVGLFDQAIG
ncbi:MAG: hypothetical protein AAGE59_26580 [Cyanobacteria bacterium P01_F01_bin.86]